MLVDKNNEPAGEYAAGISRETFGMLKHLCKKDNYHWAIALGKDYAIIAFAIYLSLGISYWFYPVSLFLIGTTQRALANVLHESAHKMLANNRAINWVSGTFLSGYLIFHLHQSYSTSHIKNHHVHLGHPEKDPDYNFHLKCGLYDVKQSEREFFLKNVVMASSGYRTVQYINYIIKDRVKAQGADKKLRNERIMLWAYWAVIVAVAAWFGVVAQLLLFWLVPLFTTAVAVGWIIELAEHYPLPAAETEKLLLTRNRKGNALENFFFGRHDDNYHLVHHLHPAIPHWNMRTPDDLAAILATGCKVRLVKGVYAEPAAIALPRGEQLNERYLGLLDRINGASTNYAFATQDPLLVQEILTSQVASRGELEMLHGVRPELIKAIKDQGQVKTRVSAVYGTHWYLHLLHRVAEFPQNIFLALDDVASPQPSATATHY